MKLSSKKKFFFSSVFVTFIISTVIFLYTIKNNIRLFNHSFLNNYNNLFLSHLKNISFQNYRNLMLHADELKKENMYLDVKEMQWPFVTKLIPFHISFSNAVPKNGLNQTYNKTTDKHFLFSVEKSKVKNDTDFSTEINVVLDYKNNELVEEAGLLLQLFQDVSGIYQIHQNYTKMQNPLDYKDLKDTENLKKMTYDRNPISAVVGDLAPKGAFEIMDQNIFVFKHINFIYLAEKDSSEEKKHANKNKILSIVKELSGRMFDDYNQKVNFYIKIAYINNEPSMQDYSDLYADLNKYNSKYILDELYDEKYLNILIADLKPLEKQNSNGQKNVKILYNKDIKNHIFCLDFESLLKRESKLNDENAVDLFNVLINFKTLNQDLILKYTANNFNFEALTQILKLGNSDELKFYKMIAKILFDLEKLNKFIANYESSRNIEMIKQKFQLIEKTLGDISKSKFSPNENNMQKLEEIFVTVKFLMESSEMANYDHYFSFEFKIGMFLPVMLPVLYGLIKTVKALSF